MTTTSDLPESKDAKDGFHETKPEDGNETVVTSATTDDVPEFGWSSYAERVNGRFAMIGFFALLLIEALSKETFLHWAGLVR